MKTSILFVSLLVPLWGLAQNAVPNPSFEEHIGCPSPASHMGLLNSWSNVIGTCEYLHECGINGFGIPVNKGGGGYARTGQAYCLFNTWSQSQYFEVLGVELEVELEAGKGYRVEFYLSMLDSVWYASKNIGAYFSAEQPPSNADSLQSYLPQVRYEGDFITDKEGWTRVSGSFVAQGGEKFMSIGNFDKYEDTETLFVPGGGIPPSHSATYWQVAAYFIDDVSVVPDSTTSVHEEVLGSITVFPNPVRDVLHIEGERIAMLRLFDISGREVYAPRFAQSQGIWRMEVGALPQGVYMLEVMLSDGRKSVHKVVRAE